ncbi:putative CCHC-type domain-containing protein, partial [Phytophthora infestans]
MQNMRGVKSPQQPIKQIPATEMDNHKINNNKLPYRAVVVSLQYLVAWTRSDMAFVVRALGRYNGAYTQDNYKIAMRAVRYMLNTSIWNDADHAIGCDTSHTNTGFVLHLQGLTWMWKGKQQGRVTKSTCASELVAASARVDNLVWARQLLSELAGAQGVSTVNCDNQSTIQVIANRGNSKRVQRYAKEKWMIAEFVDDGVVEVR